MIIECQKMITEKNIKPQRTKSITEIKEKKISFLEVKLSILL